MAVESKPLFHPEVIRQHLRHFNLPDAVANLLPKLQVQRQEYTTTIEPARTLAAEALKLEHQINDLVNQAYGLTPEEIDLMWKTAPPRMPIARPKNCGGGL